METLSQLFEYQLQLAYSMEHRLLVLLRQTAAETRSAKLRKALAVHCNGNLAQIKRLERVFRMIGKPPAARTCHELEGFIRQKEEFERLRPSRELRDWVNLDIARKIEQYEIVCYASLHNLAAKLRLPAAVKLIRDNLRDEEDFLFQLKLQSPRLSSERLVPAA